MHYCVNTCTVIFYTNHTKRGGEYLWQRFSQKHRWFSKKAHHTPPPLEGFRFDIDLNEAVKRFESFCTSKGISGALQAKNFIRNRPSLSYDKVTAYFIPLWCFDCGVRITSRKKIMRETRTGYSSACMVYGGYAYPRALIHGLTSTLMGTQLFDKDWLNASFGTLPIKMDTWSVFQSTAWSIARKATENLEKKHAQEAYGDTLPSAALQSKFALHGVRRVMIPVFVFEYALYGQLFHVFVSGRRSGPEFSGIDHGNVTASLKEGFKSASVQVDKLFKDAMRHLAGSGITDSHFGRMASTFLGRFIVVTLGYVATVSRIIIMRFPLFWPIAIGGFIIFRKIIMPIRSHRALWTNWVNIANEEIKLQKEEGDVWYWTDQYKPQQEDFRKSSRTSNQQAYRQQRYAREASQKLESMSPYEILGVSPWTSSKELTDAYRREMLKWHPDLQAGKNEEEQAYALARAQAITRAYRLLRKS